MVLLELVLLGQQQIVVPLALVPLALVLLGQQRIVVLLELVLLGQQQSQRLLALEILEPLQIVKPLALLVLLGTHLQPMLERSLLQLLNDRSQLQSNQANPV